MPEPIRITTNADAVASRITELGEAVGDLRPAFQLMLGALRRSEAATFASSGEALGASWPAAADPDRKTDSRLLVATGALVNSLAGMTGDSVAETSTTEMFYGTEVEYAHFHQYGTKRMPARPFLGVTPGVENELMQILNERLAFADEGDE